MTKTQLSLNGLNIAYIEVNISAPKTIFFLHGNSLSAQAWRKQLSSPLFNEYRLIAFDLPAHGNSDLPDETFCTLPGMAEIMQEAIKRLLRADEKYIIVSLSLATNMLAEMLAFDILPNGLVMVGPSVLTDLSMIEKITIPNTHAFVVFQDEADPITLNAYTLETSLSRDQNDIDLFQSDYSNTKKPFRSLLANSIFANQFGDQLALLNQSGIPTLIVFGKDEKIVFPDYLDGIDIPAWKNKIFKIEGASHLVNIDQPDKFNELLAEYAAERFK